jgi:hypothetical protein
MFLRAYAEKSKIDKVECDDVSIVVKEDMLIIHFEKNGKLNRHIHEGANEFDIVSEGDKIVIKGLQAEYICNEISVLV